MDQLTNLKTIQDLVYKTGNNDNLTLAIFHIENLSRINAEYGYDFGDRIIINSANKIQKHFKDCEIYKLHGGRFAVLNIYDESNFDAFKSLIKSFFVALRKRSDNVAEIDLIINMTAGVAFGEHALRRAEVARKSAKEDNKDYIVAKEEDKYYPQLKKYESSIRLINDALEQDLVAPYFQAIQDIRTGEIVKYECLARIIYNDKQICPDVFIPVAKHYRVYSGITKAMIVKSIDAFKDNDYSFTINFVLSDLLNDEIMDLLIELVTKHDVKNRIAIEIVESESLVKKDKDMASVYQAINRLKSNGIQIAIDDFGTEYSNFDIIRVIRPAFLKIDGSFIRAIQEEEMYLAVKGIVEMAKGLKIKTIAEYVEDKGIYELCESLGIDFAQGYHIGKPEGELLAS